MLAPPSLLELATTSGGRALLNRVLDLGVASKHDLAVACATANAHHTNMTLSQGALAALNDSDYDARAAALKAFHDRWQHNPLVMEKWFMLEASSAQTGNIQQLQKLMQHPAFDPGNPNKLRAVLGAFMTANPVHFYAADGSGFAFIGDCLIDIDRSNPQLASRMALPLTRMAFYGLDRQTQMISVLREIQKAAGSADLREVVDKALDAKA